MSVFFFQIFLFQSREIINLYDVIGIIIIIIIIETIAGLKKKKNETKMREHIAAKHYIATVKK